MRAYTQLQEAGTDGPRGIHLALMTCGTAAVVALAAVVVTGDLGARHVTTDNNAASRGAVLGHIGRTSLGSAPGQGSARVRAEPRPMESDTLPLVYLVASQEQADRLSRALGEANAIRSSANAGLVEAIVLIDSDVALELLRQLPDPPDTRIIDLREN
jgi:hypothetical protein